MFLARILGILYIIKNVDDKEIRENAHSRLFGQFVCFLILFVAYLVHLLLKDGFAYNDEGVIFIEPYKYLHNFLDMWPLTIILLIGVVLVLYGTVKSGIQKTYTKGIWPAGIGVVLVVLPLLLMSAWNHTAYYPSTADLQSSLTMANSCSSEFTLRTMFYVSLLVPFVLAYIVYAWRAIDKKKLDKQEIIDDHAY
jgi:cytochrome d ubiquinol oxidase subunit II